MKKRIEIDSLGKVEVEKDKLWGAQTQRSLIHFSIGQDLIPRELIYSYALIKHACALANYKLKKLSLKKKNLIVSITKDIFLKKYDDSFPLHVWMTGSGTQFNMNMNEVISNIACLKMKKPLGSKDPLHPNDDVNMSQSSNDTFPTAMHVAVYNTGIKVFLPALNAMFHELNLKVTKWERVIKIGRTHLQDAVPLSLGQEFLGYAGIIKSHIEKINFALSFLLEIPLGGTAVGTGLNAPVGFDKIVAQFLSKLTGYSFRHSKNKFALQGSHDHLISVMSSIKNVAISLFKIANDIRLLSCGPRAGFFELLIPQNEPGSSIMPGKINPTQCEALAMVAAQVMGLDVAVSIAGSGGILEMNVYKPMIVFDILSSMTLLADSVNNFTRFLLIDVQANEKKINEYVENSLMLGTALSPIIGYDKASALAHHAYDNNCSLEESNKILGFLSEADFKKYTDVRKMI